jgi:hypothetical protein
MERIDKDLLEKHYGEHWSLCGNLVPDSSYLTTDKDKVTCRICLDLLEKQSK